MRRLLLVEKLTNVLPKDGHVGPSTSRKKDFNVVTSPITAEKPRRFFFVHASPLSGSFFIFLYLFFNFLLIFFFLSITMLLCKIHAHIHTYI